MSYLDHAKQVEARLRAARETRPGYERNEVTKEVTGAANAPAPTEALSAYRRARPGGEAVPGRRADGTPAGVPLRGDPGGGDDALEGGRSSGLRADARVPAAVRVGGPSA